MQYKLAENTWNSEELLAGVQTLLSGRCTMGDRVKEFEQKFAETFNSKYAVMSNSGSSANLLMVAALKYSNKNFEDGDEIIVPSVSWATTYYPIHQLNLKLKFVDINLDTLNIDETKIEQYITPKTKGIMAVNILGNPCNFKVINDIAKRYNLVVLEDNCESMFAKYDNKFCGTIGQMGTFSTFFSHHICTIEGGITVTDSEELYQYMLSLRAHGWTRELPSKNFVYEKSGKKIDDMFKFILPGYNLRPTEISAAIGLQQLKKLPGFIDQRIKNYNLFNKIVTNLNNKHDNVLTIQKMEDNSSPSYFAFTMILSNKIKDKREDFMNFLLSHNIECRPIVAGNFTKNPVIKYLNNEICGEMTNADIIDSRGLFIGNHSQDISNELIYFNEICEDFISRV